MAQLTKAHEARKGGLRWDSMGSPEKVPSSPAPQTRNLYHRETGLSNVSFDPNKVDKAEREADLCL